MKIYQAIVLSFALAACSDNLESKLQEPPAPTRVNNQKEEASLSPLETVYQMFKLADNYQGTEDFRQKSIIKNKMWKLAGKSSRLKALLIASQPDIPDFLMGDYLILESIEGKLSQEDLKSRRLPENLNDGQPKIRVAVAYDSKMFGRVNELYTFMFKPIGYGFELQNIHITEK